MHHSRGACSRACAALILTLAGAPPALALQLANDGDFKANWDTTIAYSAAWRVKSADAALLVNPNTDDGDRNFNRGIVSNRLDLLSELDVLRGPFGLRLSAAGWYDTVYNKANDNSGFAGGAFPNQASVAHDRFTERTRKLHGRQVELRDAFVQSRLDAPLGPLSVRLGQHSLLWGESLFFAGNAIAGAQMPFDVSRLLAQPGAQAKEFVLPVPQISAQWQVATDVSVGAYAQFRFRENRLPAVGSYFSQTDLYVDGGEQLLLDPSVFAAQALRSPDQKPKDGGQFGVQLRWQWNETDFGLYALRFHDKGFQPVTELGLAPTSVPAVACAGAFGPAGVVIGSTCFLAGAPTGYHAAYPQGVRAFGISASRTFGAANVAIEASIRRGQALASSHGFDASALGAPPTNLTDNPPFAVGNTAHINLSTLWTLPETPLWREATFIGEIAWNRVLSCTRNCEVATATSGALDPNATRDATALRFVLRPSYRQVVSGLDVVVPFGLGWSPKGSRSMALGAGALPPAGGGDLSLGLEGEWQSTWRFSLTGTHFFGPAATFLDSGNFYSYGQSLRDRDFLALSLRRTF